MHQLATMYAGIHGVLVGKTASMLVCNHASDLIC